MAAAHLTAARLRELLHYDPATGLLTWRVTRSRNARAGQVAGSPGSNSYLQIQIDGRTYLAHRLAWLHFYGVWPVNQIDHRNGLRHENWIDNLRDVTNTLNSQNQRAARPDSKTGLLGVCLIDGKWRAQIKTGRRTVWLGEFPCPEAAHEAYRRAKRAMHPGCTI